MVLRNPIHQCQHIPLRLRGTGPHDEIRFLYTTALARRPRREGAGLMIEAADRPHPHLAASRRRRAADAVAMAVRFAGIPVIALRHLAWNRRKELRLVAVVLRRALALQIERQTR